jgi:hypothetical protein
MDLDLRFRGDIVERQELLNGTQMVTLDGVTEDGAWTLVGDVSWNIGLAETHESDLTLASEADGELFATLAAGHVRDAAGSGDADYLLDLEYRIEGGSGSLADARGEFRLTGKLVNETFTAEVIGAVTPGAP